jgi:hypothetical protein
MTFIVNSGSGIVKRKIFRLEPFEWRVLDSNPFELLPLGNYYIIGAKLFFENQTLPFDCLDWFVADLGGFAYISNNAPPLGLPQNFYLSQQGDITISGNQQEQIFLRTGQDDSLTGNGVLHLNLFYIQL